MNTTFKIIRYEIQDVWRSKWIIFYTLLFLLITDSLFRFGGDSARVILSLMNVVLIVIPLVSIVFGSMYLYNSREFIELLLSQPINRKHLYIGLYSGVALPLAFGFIVGSGLPFIYFYSGISDNIGAVLLILGMGTALTFIFLALSFFISVYHEDRVKGLGTLIMIWLFFTVIYDGLVLFFIYFFADYPLDKAVIFLSCLNPIDLGRIALLLEFDISAMMGYTGAVFKNFFGSASGFLVAAASMLLWIVVPFYFGMKKFIKKDF